MRFWTYLKRAFKHDIEAVGRVEVPLCTGRITVRALIALAYINGWIGGMFWAVLFDYVKRWILAGWSLPVVIVLAVLGTLLIIAYTLFMLFGMAEDTARANTKEQIGRRNWEKR